MEEKWQVELTLIVKGPKEGPVTTTIAYEDTTRDMAVGLQNALAKLGLSLNGEG